MQLGTCATKGQAADRLNFAVRAAQECVGGRFDLKSRRYWLPFLLLLLIAVIVPDRIKGQGTITAHGPVDPSYLNLLEWRMAGPSRGGRSVAVAGDPKNRLVFYLGTTGGGVWKTENGGITWRNISDHFFKTASVGAIAVAPSDPNVIYVGMGESCFRGDASYGDGVYKSTDGGKTWVNMGLIPTRQIARIRIHPQNPNLAYVAAFGDGFGPGPDRGVYRTKDGGKTWEKVLFRSENAGAIDLSMDPNNPNVVYASLLEFQRFPWGLRGAGPGTGLFKTTDGGDHWTELTNNPGLPAGIKGRIGVALSPARPERIWALVDAETGKKGLFRSDDGGATWRLTSQMAGLTVRPWYFHHVFADPKNPDVVYVLNIQAYKSTDGGANFGDFRPPHGDHHDLWIDPNDPTRMIEANDGGGTVTFDGGKSWSSLLNQPTAQFYHVIADNQFPYRLYAAQQDNTTISVPSRSDFGSITEQEWFTVGGGEAGFIAVKADDPNIIVAAEHHMLERYDLKSKQNQDIGPWPESNWGWGDRAMKYRFQWTYPVLRSPHDPNIIYATSQFVHRTKDEGRTWENISPDLTRHDPSKLEPMPSYGDPISSQYWGPITRDDTGVEWYSTVFAFAESTAKKDLLWAGSDDGYVQVSQDGGKHWTNVTPKDLPEFAMVTIIEPSPHDPASAYVAATRYKLQDQHPYLYKTHDYGKTWTQITAGIPDNDFTRVIREDPEQRGLLFAGTETGVYVSFDDGADWQSLRLNLPATPVHDLIVKNGDLVAATHGRSFWILDNAALLHQFDPATFSGATHLFAPRTSVRFRASAALAVTETGGGNEGRNPPNGAVVEWYSKQAPQGEVTLTFADPQDHEIRTFARVPAKAGANRFVWDLRYPWANVIAGTTLRSRRLAPLALPGKYQVKLRVDGQTYTESFDVVKDPRVTVSDADLREQFKFLMAVRDKLTETHDTVRKIREMRSQAQEAVRKAQGTADVERLTQALKRLDDKLYPIEERLSQFRAKDIQDLTNYGNAVDDKLANLLDLAGRADARPTRSEYDVLEYLSGELKQRQESLERVRSSEWTSFAAK
jgi:photosystem II stability/assembly factor-like uncharacterized protein